MIPILVAMWTANYRVYGAHKLWKAARRAGHEIGRDQVARLMRQAGIEGVSPTATVAHHDARIRPRRGRRISCNATSPPTMPNELWVTDLTYVPTWAGVAYVCFIVDAFSRMIVGWRVASHMRTGMVLDALEMARWSRGTRLEGLRCHSDAGSQFTSIRYGERLAEIGAQPSIGIVGDSLRQRARRDGERALQDRAHPRARPRAVEDRRRRRARDARLGALAQHRTPPRLPRRRPARPSSKPLTTLQSSRPPARPTLKSNSPEPLHINPLGDSVREVTSPPEPAGKTIQPRNPDPEVDPRARSWLHERSPFQVTSPRGAVHRAVAMNRNTLGSAPMTLFALIGAVIVLSGTVGLSVCYPVGEERQKPPSSD